MKAAVLSEVKQPLTIEDIDLIGPGDGEVLVRIRAVGVCHTDLHAAQGKSRAPLPIVLGHEGAGVVERVGSAVTTVRPGDPVVLTPLPYCGKCRQCQIGKPYLCKGALALVFSGTLMDGSKKLRRKNGAAISHLFCQSSFAEYAVVPEVCAVKIRSDAPLDKVALLGCGAATGLGAVLNVARVESGSRVTVFGCGGVGLSAIMGARIAGAAQVIAVDTLDSKLELAQELGATHVVNAARQNALEEIRKLSDGGVDYAFECIGNTQVMEQAFQVTAPGGKTIIAGVAGFGASFKVNAMNLLFDRSIQGLSGGNIRPPIDIPKFVDFYMNGQLPLDRLISRTYRLEQINEALTAIETGEVVRGVVVF